MVRQHSQQLLLRAKRRKIKKESSNSRLRQNKLLRLRNKYQLKSSRTIEKLKSLFLIRLRQPNLLEKRRLAVLVDFHSLDIAIIAALYLTIASKE